MSWQIAVIFLLGLLAGLMLRPLFPGFGQRHERSIARLDDTTFPPVPVGTIELADSVRDWAIGSRNEGGGTLHAAKAPFPNLADDVRTAIVAVFRGSAPPGPAAALHVSFQNRESGLVELETLPLFSASARRYVMTWDDGFPLRVVEEWRLREDKLRPLDPESFARRFKIPTSEPQGGQRMRDAIQTILRERGLEEDSSFL